MIRCRVRSDTTTVSTFYEKYKESVIVTSKYLNSILRFFLMFSLCLIISTTCLNTVKYIIIHFALQISSKPNGIEEYKEHLSSATANESNKGGSSTDCQN